MQLFFIIFVNFCEARSLEIFNLSINDKFLSLFISKSTQFLLNFLSKNDKFLTSFSLLKIDMNLSNNDKKIIYLFYSKIMDFLYKNDMGQTPLFYGTNFAKKCPIYRLSINPKIFQKIGLLFVFLLFLSKNDNFS